jgi:hypothetical protein
MSVVCSAPLRSKALLVAARPSKYIHFGRKLMSTKSDNDNHSNQLNPNNDEYWHSRDEDERPDDWEDRVSVPDNSDG